MSGLPNVVEPLQNVVRPPPNVVELKPNVVEPRPNIVESSSSSNSAAAPGPKIYNFVEAIPYDGGGNSSASARFSNVVEPYDAATYPVATASSASKAPSTRKIYSMIQTQNLNYINKPKLKLHVTNFLTTTTKQTLLVCPLFYKIKPTIGKGTFYMPESKDNLKVIEMEKKDFYDTTTGTIDSLIEPIIEKILKGLTITHILVSLRFNMDSNSETIKLMETISEGIGEPLIKALEANNITVGLIPGVTKEAIIADLYKKYHGELLDMTELEIKNVAMLTELLTGMKKRIDNGDEPSDFFIDVGPLILYLRKLPPRKITAKARIHLKSLDAVMSKIATKLRSYVGGARRTRSGRKTRKTRSGRKSHSGRKTKSRKSHRRR